MFGRRFGRMPWFAGVLCFDARQALTAVNAPPRDHNYAAAPAQASDTLGYGVRVIMMLHHFHMPDLAEMGASRDRRILIPRIAFADLSSATCVFSFCLLLFFACSALAAKLAAAGAAAEEGAGVEAELASMLCAQRFQTAFGSTAWLALNFFPLVLCKIIWFIFLSMMVVWCVMRVL